MSRLHRIFVADFREAGRTFRGISVAWDDQVRPGEVYEEGFWHLVSRQDQRTGGRHFDPQRAERLPWCGPLLSHADDAGVRVWDYREGHGRLRTYVWLEHWDYVVVLEARVRRTDVVVFLVTAFHVDGESRRRALRKKHRRGA